MSMTRRQFLVGTMAALPCLRLARDAACCEPGARDAGPRLTRDRLGLLIYSYQIRARREPHFADPTHFMAFGHQQGFAGVQVPLGMPDSDGIRAIRDTAAKHQMYIEGIVRPPQDGDDVGRFDAELQAAREAGVEVLRTVMLGGRRYEVFHTADEYRQFKDRSRRSLELAEPVVARHRLKLAVENHKDYRVDEMLDVLSRLGSEYVGVCLDTGNNMALLDDPWRVIDALAPRAFTVHFKDMAVEESSDGFLMAEVPLGTGFLDPRRIIQRVSGSNPHAHFNLEMITRDPLRIPCLTDDYWATLAGVPARDLAHSLSLVRQHARPTGSLPRITQMPPDEQLAHEQEHVARSFAYAQATLFE